jgi:hypothetical protein
LERENLLPEGSRRLHKVAACGGSHDEGKKRAKQVRSAQNALGLERAKKMFTFQFNVRAKAVDQDDIGLLLSVVEGEVVEGEGKGKLKLLKFSCAN